MERSTSDEILSVIEAKLQILGFKLVNKVKNLTTSSVSPGLLQAFARVHAIYYLPKYQFAHNKYM